MCLKKKAGEEKDEKSSKENVKHDTKLQNKPESTVKQVKVESIKSSFVGMAHAIPTVNEERTVEEHNMV